MDDKKWLVTYADVALNGTKHVIHDYSPEIGQQLNFTAISRSRVFVPVSCRLLIILIMNNKGSKQ